MQTLRMYMCLHFRHQLASHAALSYAAGSEISAEDQAQLATFADALDAGDSQARAYSRKVDFWIWVPQAARLENLTQIAISHRTNVILLADGLGP